MDVVETIKKMKNIIPDATHVASGLVLINIQMPHLNDIEATKKIRVLEKSIEMPIIALTAGILPVERKVSASRNVRLFNQTFIKSCVI